MAGDGYSLTIKAVLFDMGNTLIKYDLGSPEEVFQRVLASLGVHRSLDELKKAFVSAEKEAKNLSLLSSFGKVECEEYWIRWDSLVLKHLGIAENCGLAKMVSTEWIDFVDCTLYPEVKAVLLELKQRGLRIGLISNAYEEEIHSILKKADLEPATFDIIVGVDTIREAKPDPHIFKYAISRLEVQPEEALLVGDSVDVDLKGAETAGLHALLIGRTA
ncbi:MAG: HAD family hydrolase [Candidatus Bathyarchaeota archaeon]|nr:HAD family hydrolase [Candidatus Bathyarchaeota archaeon]